MGNATYPVTYLFTGSIIVRLCCFKSAIQAHIATIRFKSSINWFDNNPVLGTNSDIVRLVVLVRVFLCPNLLVR